MAVAGQLSLGRAARDERGSPGRSPRSSRPLATTLPDDDKHDPRQQAARMTTSGFYRFSDIMWEYVPSAALELDRPRLSSGSPPPAGRRSSSLTASPFRTTTASQGGQSTKTASMYVVVYGTVRHQGPWLTPEGTPPRVPAPRQESALKALFNPTGLTDAGSPLRLPGADGIELYLGRSSICLDNAGCSS
jgi:hypothetical protein